MRAPRPFLPAVVACVVAVAAAACAGKSAKDADTGLEPVGGGGATLIDAGNDFPLPYPDGAFADDGGAGGSDAARVYDAGPRVTLDGGLPCVAGGVVEVEPNDQPGDANALAPTVCGAVDAPDAVDWLAFELKATTKHMYVGFDGNVRLTVSVEGKPEVVLTPQSAPAVPFVRGKPYHVRVESMDGARQVWRVTLFEFER